MWQDHRRWRELTGQQRQQVLRRRLTHLGKRHVNRGQGGIHILAHFGVAAADDRYIVRHLQSGRANFGNEAEHQDIARARDGGGPVKTLPALPKI